MIFSPDEIHLELPASSKYLNVLSACIAEMLSRVEGLSDVEQTVYNVQLAVHEGCTNIVDHAYGQEAGRIGIHLELCWQPAQIIIELHDTGYSFDFNAIQTPTLGEPQVRGYGLFLMREIMDEVIYRPAPGRNCWRLVKYLQA